jgi:hypothetical protein
VALKVVPITNLGGPIMFPSNEIADSKMSAAQADCTTSTSPTTSRTTIATTTVAPASRDSTKDAGRVHIGGGLMRF